MEQAEERIDTIGLGLFYSLWAKHEIQGFYTISKVQNLRVKIIYCISFIGILYNSHVLYRTRRQIYENFNKTKSGTNDTLIPYLYTVIIHKRKLYDAAAMKNYRKLV
jgi:Na+(H+)/acetate symporter ActP